MSSAGGVSKDDISSPEIHEGEHAHCEGDEGSATHDALVQTEVILGSSDYTSPKNAKVNSVAQPQTIVKEDWNGAENGQSHEDLANEKNNNEDKTLYSNLLKPQEVSKKSLDEGHDENEGRIDEGSDDDKETDKRFDSASSLNIEHEPTNLIHNNGKAQEKESEERGFQESENRDHKDHGDFESSSKFDENEQESEQGDDNKEFQETEPKQVNIKNSTGTVFHDEDAVISIQNKGYEHELQGPNDIETEVRENLSQEASNDMEELQDEKNEERGLDNEVKQEENTLEKAESDNGPVEQNLLEVVSSEENQSKPGSVDATEAKTIMDNVEEENIKDSESVGDEEKEIHEDEQNKAEAFEHREQQIDLDKDKDDLKRVKQHNYLFTNEDNEMDRSDGSEEEIKFEGNDETATDDVFEENVEIQPEEVDIKEKEEQGYEIKSDEDIENLEVSLENKDSARTEKEQVADPSPQEIDVCYYEPVPTEESIGPRQHFKEITVAEQEIEDKEEEGISQKDNGADEDNLFVHERTSTPGSSLSMNLDLRSEPSDVSCDLSTKESPDTASDEEAEDIESVHGEDEEDTVTEFTDKMEGDQASEENGESSCERLEVDQTDETELDELNSNSTTKSLEKKIPTLLVSIENNDEEVNSTEEESSLVPKTCLEIVSETDVESSAPLHVKNVKELFETQTHLNEDEKGGKRNEYHEAPVSPGLVSSLRKFFENPKNFEYIKP